MASTYTLISSQVLSSSAASVTFSSIPSTYKDLALMISARSDAVFATGSEIIGVSFNGSGGIAYSNTYMQGNGSSYGYQTATSWMRYTNTNGTTTNTFGSMEIYIPSYTASQKKQISAIGVSETNATAVFMGVNAGLWSNTAAITSVTLGANYDSTRNFLTGSSFYLYGI